MNTTSLHRTAPIDKPAGRSSRLLGTGGIIVVVVVLATVGLLALLAICCILRWRRKQRTPAATRPRGRLPAETAIVHTEEGGAGEGIRLQAAGCEMCRRPYDNALCTEAPTRLDCGHVFHERCIKRWLAVNLACPVCNATHIELCRETPGEASAPRHRYSSSNIDSLVTSKDDIAIYSSSFRVQG